MERIGRISKLALGTALLLVGCGGDLAEERAPGAAGPQPSLHTARSLQDTYSALGVDTTLGARKDPSGKDVSADYHPLSRKHTAVAALSELYYTGFDLMGADNLPSGAAQGLLEDADPDDKKADLGLLYRDKEEKWVTTPHATGKGDVDGDGLDEVVVVHVQAKGELWLRLIDGASDKSSKGEAYASTTSLIETGVKASGGLMTMTLCDIDGDDRDEIAFADGPTLYVFDDAGKKFKKLASRSYDKTDTVILPHLQLACGDMNGDGQEQLVVVHSAGANSATQGFVNSYIYDSKLDLTASGTPLIVQTSQTVAFVNAFVAVADLDRDGIDELILTASPNRLAYVTMVFDDQRAKGALICSHIHSHITFGVQVLDVDHDGTKEIVAGSDLLKFDDNELKPFQEPNPASTGRLNFPLSPFHAAGDIDGDLQDELVIYYFNKGLGWLEIWGLDTAGNFSLQTVRWAQPKAWPTLVLANVDRDSLVLKYKSHELRFSRPQVLVAMAAPPYHTGLKQNLDAMGTTFGKTEGSQVETSKSIGFSTGLSIGFSSEVSAFGVKVFEAQSMTSFETSMNWTATKTSTVTTSYAFSSGADEDKVVFTAVPYDVYSYEVVSADDPSAVGETVTVSLPRKPQTFSVSRTYYNANNGDAPDIDSAVLSHTIGDPASYPGVAGRNKLLDNGKNGWRTKEPVTVGEGSGSQTLTIDVTEGNTLGMDSTMTINSELEITAGGFKMGMSMGVSTGFGYTVTAEKGFFVEGTIGDIPSGNYGADKLYRAGLFTYRATAQGQPLLVINYWVE